MALVFESQGNDKSSFAYCNKMSRSRHGRRKYEVKRHNANTKTLRTNSWGANLSPAYAGCPAREATGKGHRHKTTQGMVKLCEVVEVAKTFEATTFANQLMKTARNTQQKQVNYTTKSPPLSQCFWCGGKHQQPCHQHCPAMKKTMCKMRHHWPLRALLQGWNPATSSTAACQFCLWRHKRGSLRYGVRYNPTVCKKTFCESAPKALDKRSRK